MTRESFYIAIVDDEESVRRALGRLLTSAGYGAQTFGSGEAFLASLSRGTPACLILDFFMPAMNGVEVLKRLKKSKHSIPVIVISGHDESDTAPRALAAGAGCFLHKPVEGDLLLSAVESAVAGAAS